MGRKELGIETIRLKDFSKGYFPNKDFDEIPDGGSSNCRHVIWYRSALRKMFGMDRVFSSAASPVLGGGLHYLNVENYQVRSFIFGNKFYEDNSGSLVDRTGAITITSGNLVQAIDHQQGANQYAIYVNGYDNPWKWTGSGNISALGGSPPVFSTVAKFHEHIFGAVNEVLYWSDVGDPETWNTSKWIRYFNKNISCVIEHGESLAVLKTDSIGSITGYTYLDFAAEETEVPNVGCAGRLAACKAFFGGNPVVATVDRNGLWIIYEDYSVEKIFGGQYFESFNKNYFSQTVVTYSVVDELLFVAIPYESSTTQNDYLIVVDMKTGAFWPCPDIHSNKIMAMGSMRDDNDEEYIYFMDNAGFVFKFNRDTKNYHDGSASSAIDSFWKSKRIDLEAVYSLQWPMCISAIEGDWSFDMYVHFGFSSSDGDYGSIGLESDGDLLGSTFVLGASVLGGSQYTFGTAEGVDGFGRFIDISFKNDNLDESFNIKMAEIQVKERRAGWNDS